MTLKDRIARNLHNKYEEFAKQTGWQTQDSCRCEFDDLPEKNKETMLLVAEYILKESSKWWEIPEDEAYTALCKCKSTFLNPNHYTLKEQEDYVRKDAEAISQLPLKLKEEE